VDDVEAREVDDRRLADGEMQLVDGDDVIGRRRILVIEADRVRLGIDQFRAGRAEFPVRTGVVDVPGELLPDHPHDGRIRFVRKAVGARGPERERKAQEEHLSLRRSRRILRSGTYDS
jgi:hypothetical protein